MNFSTQYGVVVAEIGSKESATSFFSEGLGAIIQSLFIVIGILVIAFTLFKAIKAFFGGKVGDLFKIIVLGIIVTVFCFDLTLMFDLIGGFTNLVKAGFTTITDILS